MNIYLKITALSFLLFLAGCEDETHRLYGTVERDVVTISAPANEQITSIAVKEGQRVNQGEVLLQLDAQNATAERDMALAVLANAKADLARLQNGERPEDIASAKAQLASRQAMLSEARKNYRRAQSLRNQALISQAEFDRRKANFEDASGQYQSALQQLDKLTAGTRIEEIDAAMANVAKADAQLRLAQHGLDELTLHAPSAAVVESIPVFQGERSQIGQPLLDLALPQSTYAQIYVPAPYVTQFQLGQAVQLSLAQSEQMLKGKVRWIASQPSFTPYYALNQKDSARLSYLMEVSLTEDIPSGLAIYLQLPEVNHD
ncbi:hypothetical protein VST7929_03020 [Vibrio stylophorae]|uniref:YbhG-like alpha-helical hairpin domain-containing protein n=1 Tax=Vibrio stylophorae TaxID=659351 RepID=A0ABN8DY93_9VIBR|nr:HlyD family efflux transporter periplasmic adaptor subunit [Vibrio stylophorae]CAH0535446.1 hypothetical protein VST7929_03020 [Vibrio stylophorae]